MLPANCCKNLGISLIKLCNKLKYRMKILYITAKFPNRIQPWFANSVAQVIKNQGEVCILSILKGDTEYIQIVDQLGLKKNSRWVVLPGHAGYMSVFFKFISIVLFSPMQCCKGMLLEPGRTYSSTLKRLANMAFLSPYFNLKGFNVVHSHSEIVGYLLLPIVEALKLPHVFTFHGLTPSGVPGLDAEKRLEYLDKVDLVLVNTEFAKQQIVCMGCDERKVKIIPQGIDLCKFRFDYHVPRIGDKILLLSVGRLTLDKGHDYTIDAVNLLIKEGVSVSLRIVGQGPDLNRLKRKIMECNLEDKIRIVTDITEEQLLAVYRESDIFILSSIISEDGWQETQGVVVQEAQAAGCLVVATRTGGIPECIKDGSTGFLVEQKSSEAIAHKIKWLASNISMWMSWKRAARMHVELNYDIEKIGQKMMNIYREIGAVR